MIGSYLCYYVLIFKIKYDKLENEHMFCINGGIIYVIEFTC